MLNVVSMVEVIISILALMLHIAGYIIMQS